MLELTKIKSGELSYLFKTVNEGVTVNEELSRSLRNVKVVLEEALYGHKSLAVKSFKRALLEYLTEEYLAVAADCTRQYLARRDKYVPSGQLWVTESGDAGCGGNTWAPTYLDVPRTLNELGEFATVSDGIIFHNTLASSAYGFLEHGTFEPRPNYFAVLLWNRLMGSAVYATGEQIREGAHVYAHSRKDGKDGYAYLIINNSRTDTTTLELPHASSAYVLEGQGKLRSRVMTLNGKPLTLGENDELPALDPIIVEGKLTLAPGACAFVLV